MLRLLFVLHPLTAPLKPSAALIFSHATSRSPFY